MNIISETLFRQKSKCSLIPFITAGYPDVETSIEVIRALDCQGADIIELGIPYSDALADGPVIQNASLVAIKQKIYIDQVLSIVQEVYRNIDAPIIIFTYYNPILKRGLNRFIEEISSAGARGLIIPDLPLEEADDLILVCNIYKIELILFVAPTSSLDRIQKITDKSPGCIYLVSSTGVTGMKDNLDKTVMELSDYIKSFSNKLIMLGFGISTPLQVEELAKWNIDGLVVGTAFIQMLSHSSRDVNVSEVSHFCQSLREAIDK